MNFKIFSGLVACVVVVSAEKDVMHFPSEDLTLLGENSVSCIGTSGIDPEWVPKLLNAEIADTPEIRKFVNCFAISSNFANKGHFDEKKMMSLLGNSNYKKADVYKQALEECNKKSGKDDEDTFFQVLQCFFGKTPVIFTL